MGECAGGVGGAEGRGEVGVEPITPLLSRVNCETNPEALKWELPEATSISELFVSLNPLTFFARG